MSYCRFSSDNFTSDFYCYESESGYVIHLAGSRWRAWWRLLHWVTDKRIKLHRPLHDAAIIFRNERRFVTWLSYKLPHALMHKRIRLNHAGACFTAETEDEMFDIVRDLHEQGFRIPRHFREIIYADPKLNKSCPRRCSPSVGDSSR